MEGLGKGEFGRMPVVDIPTHTKLFGEDIEPQNVWMSHGDEATVLPDGFKCIGKSEQGCVVAIEHETKNLFGLQYHPEVTHSEKGMRTLKHFLFNIAKCERSWSMANVLEE